MPDSPSGQYRTPSTLKWLLNERAAIAGEVKKATLRSQALETKLAALQISLTNLQHKIESVSAVKTARQATLAALDTAIGLAYQDVRPDAAGIVHAVSGKYGKRGGLVEFVARTLRVVSPAPVSGKQLISLVAWHFQIALTSPQDRRSLKQSVKSAIADLSKRGLVCPAHPAHPAHPADGATPGLWRWKQPTTLADLAAKAAGAAGAETVLAIGGTPAAGGMSAAGDALTAGNTLATGDTRVIGTAPDAEPFSLNAGSPSPTDPNTSRCEVAPQ